MKKRELVDPELWNLYDMILYGWNYNDVQKT